MVAPRIVHFAEGQLYWQCHELRAWEECLLGEQLPPLPDSPRVAPDEVRRKTKEFQVMCNAASTPRSITPGSKETYKFLYAWADLLHCYSAKNLSVAQDKLVAVSAIARQFGSYAGHRYLAGLWDVDIWRQLCWEVLPTRNEESPRRSPGYVAPSWSWASVDGRVNLGMTREELVEQDLFAGPFPCVSIHGALVTPDGSNEFGIVVDGVLEVSGLLFPIRANTPQIPGLPHPHDEPRNHFEATLDGSPAPLTLVADDLKIPDLDGPLYCMPVHTDQHPDWPWVELAGLVLKASGGRNTFRSIVVVKSWSNQHTQSYGTRAKSFQSVRRITMLNQLGDLSMDTKGDAEWNPLPLTSLKLQRLRIV